MGQKVNPKGLRVGVIKDWDSRWFADKKDFSDYLVEDHKIRELIKKESFSAGISSIAIERASNKIKVTINTAKPGMVIGRQGAGVEELKNKLEKLTGKKLEQKELRHYTGYAGGLKSITYKDLMEKDPERAVTHAIVGMLPHNSLGRQMAKKLRVYRGADHDHIAQNPEVLEIK